VAPKNPFKDRLTGKMMDPVTTGQIYMGAIPFVVIQCIMVALVIMIPSMVMVYKTGEIKLDASQVEEQFKGIGLPPVNDAAPELKF
jgi:hypothetical protein